MDVQQKTATRGELTPKSYWYSWIGLVFLSGGLLTMPLALLIVGGLQSISGMLSDLVSVKRIRGYFHGSFRDWQVGLRTL
jgi:hypothetical protein